MVVGERCVRREAHADGQQLVYSTLLGGSDVDFAEDIAVDEDGNAYVAGTTYSSDFPTTKTAVQRRTAAETATASSRSSAATAC